MSSNTTEHFQCPKIPLKAAKSKSISFSSTKNLLTTNNSTTDHSISVKMTNNESVSVSPETPAVSCTGPAPPPLTLARNRPQAPAEDRLSKLPSLLVREQQIPIETFATAASSKDRIASSAARRPVQHHEA
ncbi:hypothetical protein BT63DRAFT_168759 [Microthyrium microscopicum]|uniref:Uncharacterized protein n=1 Tax=Microthyrium microscopicum TaxID=703497 RepID=A0A6A6UR42_9PEZI|nr:hypothetical protein BT63DRAFT_168759 [Microthyrium microscopicum]